MLLIHVQLPYYNFMYLLTIVSKKQLNLNHCLTTFRLFFLNMAKNIHGWMGFLSDNEIVCCLWYLDTKFMILVNILFWKIENMWFFTFLGCNWWKMRAAQKLFLILCQVYIYLQKIPRPIRFEEKVEVPPTPR